MGVNHDALEIGNEAPVPSPAQSERIHLNKVEVLSFPTDLVMSRWNIQRYDHPSPDTSFALEYAFYLLGEVAGKTIVDLGCGEGLNTVILAALGARVIAVDISTKSLETTSERVRANRVERNVLLVHGDAGAIPIEDARVDGVLCAALLQHVDCLTVARQIRRILKPGGVASFVEHIARKQIHSISRAVGRAGRSRKFMLASRLLDRIGIRRFPATKKSHQTDSRIRHRFEFPGALASPVVWEALKER